MGVGLTFVTEAVMRSRTVFTVACIGGNPVRPADGTIRMTAASRKGRQIVQGIRFPPGYGGRETLGDHGADRAGECGRRMGSVSL